MSLEIKILAYDADDTAESGTTTTNITMTGHGLVTGDYIVNITRSADADRGSRKVTKVDADNITVTAITGQTTGDTIKKFKFTDRAGLLRTGTFSVAQEAEDESNCRLELKTSASYIPRIGQEIIIEKDSDRIFGGIINNARRYCPDESNSVLFVSVESDGYNTVPARRTVQPNHTDTTAGAIVTYWINNALFQEGITAGTIDTGCSYTDFIDSAMSIKDILDKCANDSGYKWYIDSSKALHFVQEDSTITDSTDNLVDDNGFTDYRGVEYEESDTDYVNKLFVVGGRDDYGYTIFVNQEDETESAARQAIEAGSGVYGQVVTDDSLDTASYEEAESGTTTTNIKLTGHALSVGDYIYNFTRSTGRNVTAVVDANNVTVNAITSQTDGDEIIIYTDANAVIRNRFKKNGIMPAEIRFDTGSTFVAGTRLNVALADYGISSSYFLIDSVEFYDLDGKNIRAAVKASLRKSSDFSTQKNAGYREYFGQMIELAKGGSNTVVDEDNNRYGVDVYNQIDAPSRAKMKSIWINQNNKSNCDGKIVSASQTISLDSGYVVLVSGSSITLTLPTIATVFAGTDTDIFEDASRSFKIKNIDSSNSVTIAAGGSDTIEDGVSTTYTLTAGNEVELFVHHTLTDWKVI